MKDEWAEKLLERVRELDGDLVRWRRYLHSHAETGMKLTETGRYVRKELEGMGYEVSPCFSPGMTCMAGGKHGGKVILLRADMDALPMEEENDLPWKSGTGSSHCCGHDLHMAMLLGAAKILKEQEEELRCTVKFMFQPDEEGGGGARGMVGEGLLEPRPAAAMALHVDAKAPLGRIDYGWGKVFASNNNLEILIHGKSGHGARPHESTDPISIGVQLYQAMESCLARERSPLEPVIFSVTSIQAGNTYNIIPDSACMKASLRTYSQEAGKEILGRLEELCKGFGRMHRTEIEMRIHHSLPPVVTHIPFTEQCLDAVREFPEELTPGGPVLKLGSEDFAFVTEEIPVCAYLFVGAGPNRREGGKYGQHTALVRFNEDCMRAGVLAMVSGVRRWQRG